MYCTLYMTLYTTLWNTRQLCVAIPLWSVAQGAAPPIWINARISYGKPMESTSSWRHVFKLFNTRSSYSDPHTLSTSSSRLLHKGGEQRSQWPAKISIVNSAQVVAPTVLSTAKRSECVNNLIPLLGIESFPLSYHKASEAKNELFWWLLLEVGIDDP